MRPLLYIFLSFRRHSDEYSLSSLGDLEHPSPPSPTYKYVRFPPPKIPFLFFPNYLHTLKICTLTTTAELPNNPIYFDQPVTAHSMAYTELFMTALIPELGVLPTIGSASENASRNENAYHEYIFHTPEAESIRSMFGDVAFSQYIEQQSREREHQILKDLHDLEEMTKIYVDLRSKSKFRRWLGWLKAAYTRDNY